jgi:hypothetical protein
VCASIETDSVGVRLDLIRGKRHREECLRLSEHFPERSAMKSEARKVVRFAVQLPCAYELGENKEDGTVLNLSTQGCAMTAERIPALATYLALRIDLLNGMDPVDIELAGVRWIFEHRCGLEFIRISPEMLVRLRSFVGLMENTP